MPAFSEAQMLHPMTLVQRFLLSIPAFVLLLYPVISSPNSADFFPVMIVVIYGVLALPLIFLRYFRFRYRITQQEITIISGVLTRKHRSIPIERIQNIEIEQSLLPRLFRTAKVKIETAGSAKTEGVLEFVGIERAHQIRQLIRLYQREQNESTPATNPSLAIDIEHPTAQSEDALAPKEPEVETLFTMPLNRVFLVGMLRFSLLYIAIAFSLFQQLNPDPDEIEIWLTRGWLRPLAEFAIESPWMLTVAAVLSAILLSWITGILVSVNKYYGFTIGLENKKLHKKHGLLTLSQGTIPIRRVQALIMRANLLMRRLGWMSLEVQTMGLESTQRGHQVAAPLARTAEVRDLAQHLIPLTLPQNFSRVSPLTIRRVIIRYIFLLLVAILPWGYYWRPALWGLSCILLIPVYAWFHYRNHGYALDADNLFVRRGVLRHYVWVIPVSKFQVLYATESFFQRRLGLCTVYPDTAGAGSWALPEIIDMTKEEASQLIQRCYNQFQTHFGGKESRLPDQMPSQETSIRSENMPSQNPPHFT